MKKKTNRRKGVAKKGYGPVKHYAEGGICRGGGAAKHGLKFSG